MSKFNQSEYQALAFAVAERASAVGNGPAIIVDTDTMNACVFQISDGGICTISATYAETASEDFFLAATHGDAAAADALFHGCEAMQKRLKKYLRRGKSEDEAIADIAGCPATSCAQLTELYDSSYGRSLKNLVEIIRSQGGENLPLIPVGRLSAFYPAEHTIREILSFAPFSPVVDGLITEPAVAVATAELIRRGKALMEELENAKKRICHNIMLQLKQIGPNGLTDWLHILARKGSDLSELAKAEYCPPVLLNAEDPIVLFADSTPYTIRLPKSIFSRRVPFVSAQFALGLAGETPKLMIKNSEGVVAVDIDPKMYTEE